MRISDWSPDVCSSDLQHFAGREVVEGDVGREDLRRHRKEGGVHELHQDVVQRQPGNQMARPQADAVALVEKRGEERQADDVVVMGGGEEDVSLEGAVLAELLAERSEEHTSELQSLMRYSYAVCCLKTKK